MSATNMDPTRTHASNTGYTPGGHAIWSSFFHHAMTSAGLSTAAPLMHSSLAMLGSFALSPPSILSIRYPNLPYCHHYTTSLQLQQGRIQLPPNLPLEAIAEAQMKAENARAEARAAWIHASDLSHKKAEQRPNANLIPQHSIEPLPPPSETKEIDNQKPSQPDNDNESQHEDFLKKEDSSEGEGILVDMMLWREGIQQLKRFKQQKGHANPCKCNVSTKEDKELADWLKLQRYKNNSLSLASHKVRMLVNLGCFGFQEDFQKEWEATGLDVCCHCNDSNISSTQSSTTAACLPANVEIMASSNVELPKKKSPLGIKPKLEHSTSGMPNSSGEEANLVWIVLDSSGIQHPAQLLDETPTQVFVKWLSNDDETWLQRVEIEIVESLGRRGGRSPQHGYRLKEFQRFWRKLKPEQVEKTPIIRQANKKMSKQDVVSTTQKNAMYGRVKPAASEVIFQVLGLAWNDIFLDLGHGIGNMVLQAAYTRGCQARGIEFVRSRYLVSHALENRMEEITIDKRKGRVIGETVLVHGDAADEANLGWLAEANKVFYNNFNGVGGERMQSSKDQQHTLDQYIGGLFASLKEGSIMVTLSDLKLGPGQSAINKWRADHGLEPDLRSCYFECVKVPLPQECGQAFTWSSESSSQTPVYLYVYKRMQQNNKRNMATIMCCNKSCHHCDEGAVFPACTTAKTGKNVVGTCECKFTPKSVRAIPVVPLETFLADPEGDFWGGEWR